MATSGNKRRIPKDITNRGNPNKRKVPRRKGSVNGPVKSGIISPISKPYKPPKKPRRSLVGKVADTLVPLAPVSAAAGRAIGRYIRKRKSPPK